MPTSADLLINQNAELGSEPAHHSEPRRCGSWDHESNRPCGRISHPNDISGDCLMHAIEFTKYAIAEYKADGVECSEEETALAEMLAEQVKAVHPGVEAMRWSELMWVIGVPWQSVDTAIGQGSTELKAWQNAA